jgi:HD-GYP domain-containing protein (c-di-GMP phosphodiesterase class II)
MNRAPRVRSAADTWVLLVVAAGAGVFALAAVHAASASRLTLALLAAGAVLTELMEVRQVGVALEGGEHSFTFSWGIFIAAVMLEGGWTGALIAGFAVLACGVARRSRPRYVAYNAAVYTLATGAGGAVFALLGGRPGVLNLPQGIAAVAGLAGTAFAVNTLLVSTIQSLSTGAPLMPLQRDKLAYELPAVVGEAGLGLALAAIAETQPWAIVALVPLVLGLYQAHARLALLHEETGRALEAFANLVDERDPSTYLHSTRVAELVGRLGHALGLPASQVARLRWAARLHDLGKIAVDSTSLGRPHDLSSSEWELMRRHPRLSARLLRRFRLAVPEARAIEYHHERYDGTGYYGIAREEVPLAAHFLIVADSFDAMISDRPYRKGLLRERALAEIERGAGQQFHPVVAKAFVALQRGIDPLAVLTPAERDLLRATAMPSGRRRKELRRIVRQPHVAPAVAIVAGLAATGLGYPVGGAAALAVVVIAHGRRLWIAHEGRRLGATLASASHSGDPFVSVVACVGVVVPVDWACLLSWDERTLEGAITAELGDPDDPPTETAVTSWIIRDAEVADDLLVSEGALGRTAHVALPLRVNDEICGYLVLRLGRALPPRLELALVDASEELGRTLAPRAESEYQRPALTAVK